MSEDANSPANEPEPRGLKFGLYGCLMTNVGFVLGSLIGGCLLVDLLGGPALDDGEDIFWMVALAIVGGIVGATLGALVGIVVGTRRR